MKMNIEKVLEAEGVYISTTVGNSMYPMLRNRKDTIIVSPCKEPLKKYDVALYRRGEKYILHRVISVLEDSYVIRGDNCTYNEYDIKQEQIIGVLTGFFRGEKEVNMNGTAYKVYARLWCALYPFRYLLIKGKSVLKRKMQFFSKGV